MWWFRAFLILTPICLLIGVGCGYSLREKGVPVGITIPSIAIPMMESKSSSPGFEADFTRMVRQEFVSHARVRVVPQEEAAFLLTREVFDITAEPLAYRSAKTKIQGETYYYDTTSSRTLRLKLKARLVDRKTGELVWEEKGMEGYATYSVSSDPMTNRYNEKRAVQTIAKDLAEKIYLKTMERF